MTYQLKLNEEYNGNIIYKLYSRYFDLYGTGTFEPTRNFENLELTIDGISVNINEDVTISSGEHICILNFKTPVNTCENMFNYIDTDYFSNIVKTINVSNLNLSHANNMSSMFSVVSDSGNMVHYDMYQYFVVEGYENWDTTNIQYMNYTFSGLVNISSVDLTNWNISNVIGMSEMFYGCNNLNEVKMGGNPSSLEYCNSIFSYTKTNGTFYYNSLYDYSLIIEQLPSTWTAVPCTLVNGVLVPNN